MANKTISDISNERLLPDGDDFLLADSQLESLSYKIKVSKLIDRANHTGSQSINTISNLQTELNNKLNKEISVIEIISPLASWIINHNFGFYPIVSTIDNSGSIIMGEINYTSLNQIVINFLTPVSGKVLLR